MRTNTRPSFILFSLWFGMLTAMAADVPYGVAPHRWPERLGSQRARIQVDQSADAVRVHLPWRRRDTEPEKKNLIVIDSATGKAITNLVRVRMNREYGDMVFQPVTVPGEYEVYYLTHHYAGPDYFPNTIYDPPVETADPAWRQRCGLTPAQLADGAWQQLPQAKLIEFQAISEFDRVDPMEQIATARECQELLARYADPPYLLFPEDRRFPIRMADDLPQRWIQAGPSQRFAGEAQPGEFYTFQIGLYAARAGIEGLSILPAQLRSKGEPTTLTPAIRCFNLGGTDWLGRSFSRPLVVPQGKVQALWFGVQIPPDATPGEYSGELRFHPKGLPETSVGLRLKVAGPVLADAGEGELWRQSRLRWLDSSLGLDDEAPPSYPPVEVKENGVAVLGRSVTLAASGLPASLRSTFSDAVDRVDASAREILARPIELVVETAAGPVAWQGDRPVVLEHTSGAVSWQAENSGGPVALVCRAKMEYDGYLNYRLSLKANRAVDLKDIRLEVPLRSAVAKYMMGLGWKGGLRAKQWNWRWDLNRANHIWWLGDVNAGLHCKLKGEEDVWELYNLKNSGIPPSWDNRGQGGCSIAEESAEGVLVRAFTGPRTLKEGEEVRLRFGLMITPVKALNREHWNWRYWHQYSPVEQVAAHGANIINLHHANELNPYINYPFVEVDKLKTYIDEAHRRGIKVKLYYTIRELSNHAAELWALRSLGHEIYRQGPGFNIADQFTSSAPPVGDVTTGSAWLCEHLVTGYVPAWHHHYASGDWDAAIATTGLSRWHNYYLEGMRWLIRYAGVDGIYLDGIGYDREIMKRLRKVMDRTQPGCLIDFHCGNHYSPQYGLNNIANQNMEHLPYIDSLWLGEGFNYDESPEYWLVELSGIPFGLFGEMLGVGNPWRGMIYGMTNRLPYAGGDPRNLWKLWDQFGIQDARMQGYWTSQCPVRTGRNDVLATAYIKPGKALVALASWAKNPVRCRLTLDWSALGLNPQKATLRAPAINGFQEKAQFQPDEEIPVPPGRGWLVLLEQ